MQFGDKLAALTSAFTPVTWSGSTASLSLAGCYFRAFETHTELPRQGMKESLRERLYLQGMPPQKRP
tara:strand:+ start:1208 stop:1408 length:201 start_codon:yes stop_codon:yes gene_type:complete